MRGHISKDDVVRPYWDQTAASTGRLQCARPNIQSVPKTSISWINGLFDFLHFQTIKLTYI